jgi:hypothetical protein
MFKMFICTLHRYSSCAVPAITNAMISRSPLQQWLCNDIAQAGTNPAARLDMITLNMMTLKCISIVACGKLQIISCKCHACIIIYCLEYIVPGMYNSMRVHDHVKNAPWAEYEGLRTAVAA